MHRAELLSWPRLDLIYISLLKLSNAALVFEFFRKCCNMFLLTKWYLNCVLKRLKEIR